jgi:hypothetical protein
VYLAVYFVPPSFSDNSLTERWQNGPEEGDFTEDICEYLKARKSDCENPSLLHNKVFESTKLTTWADNQLSSENSMSDLNKRATAFEAI